ncbi:MULTISPECIES: hypothetical protein [unclassified Paenibacillus]|uniref:hypothetical protein n=1 Tax=unclassified Paenibacillus TaxID=185978 RepID=UPI0029054483|nr:hypothetical protein [Paenibacillus sp.]MDU2240642.1 hypothetical protein [Paenibacillus sp.]
MTKQQDIIEKIKTKGYTRVILRPSTHENEKIKSLTECRSIIEQCKVSMRGWDFPHIDRDLHGNDQSFVFSGTDWSRYKELWRFYQSGQFVYLGGLYEDWENETVGLFGPQDHSLGFKGYAIDGNLYRFTEILEFAARLVPKGVFDGLVNVEITLFDTADRRLFFYERGRHLVQEAKSMMSEIKFEKAYTEDEVLTRGHEIAVEIAQFFFERFNWQNLRIEVLRELQHKFISGRY